MKANELRIGNLVTNEWHESFKDIIIVESINKNGINLFIEDDGKWAEISQRWISPEINFEELRPIPLTEEWLLNFGYKHVNTLNDGTKSFEGRPYCYFLNGELTISTATYHKIKYVHQFQNLIFALTGEELTIKS